MKSLVESILSSTNTGIYKLGTRFEEDDIPCTVIGRDSEYAYLLSDPVNIGKRGRFFDVHTLQKDDEAYKEIFHSDNLFPVHGGYDVSLYAGLTETKEFVKKELKKYKGWDLPKSSELRDINGYDYIKAPYDIISATTQCWCYCADLFKPRLTDLRVYSLKNNWLLLTPVRSTYAPIRLLKKVPLKN